MRCVSSLGRASPCPGEGSRIKSRTHRFHKGAIGWDRWVRRHQRLHRSWLISSPSSTTLWPLTTRLGQRSMATSSTRFDFASRCCSDANTNSPTTRPAWLASWPSSPAFTARDRACLAYTEQFVIDVASMPDHLVDDLKREVGESGLVDFTQALLVIEQRQRLTLTWARLFDGAN